MKYLNTLILIVRNLGIHWLFFRIFYAIKLKLGWYQWITPALPWRELTFKSKFTDPNYSNFEVYANYRREKSPAFFFSVVDREDYTSLFSDAGSEIIKNADAILQGMFLYFSKTTLNNGFPPDWHCNQFTGEYAPNDTHWSKLSEFDFGDIKIIWELNRFTFVYSLVRAYWHSDDSRYAEAFWKLVEDWQNHNPPNCGVNWKCGQEITFRVMAWCFGLYGFMDSTSSSDMRICNLTKMIAVSGERIENNIDYALSQNNNHGISEAAGLYTLGLLFPEFKRSAIWKKKGRKHIINQVNNLVYDDGSFSQYSLNYQRLLLEELIWIAQLASLNNEPYESSVIYKIKTLKDFLFQCQDETSGRLPSYGAQDGTYLLPLSQCDFLDYRPTIQLAQYLTEGNLAYESGPWDEALFWLFGKQALKAEKNKPSRTDFVARETGYYTIRTPLAFAFIRCGRHFHRPSHADQLHVDLWWRVVNIAQDAGTYSYNARSPHNHAYKNTSFHNTVTVGWSQSNGECKPVPLVALVVGTENLKLLRIRIRTQWIFSSSSSSATSSRCFKS